jgi:hypothetical protein
MNSGDEARTDVMLQNLLAVPPREPDESFVLRIERLARAERQLQSARQAALRRFAGEMAALASLAAAFLLIRGLAASDSGGAMLSSAPAIGVLMLLFVWLCAETRAEFLPAHR